MSETAVRVELAMLLGELRDIRRRLLGLNGTSSRVAMESAVTMNSWWIERTAVVVQRIEYLYSLMKEKDGKS